jgi:hypothetical protein
VHPTYRYLERRARIAGLTWRQWLMLCTGGLLTYLLAKLLPLPAPYGLSVALTLAGTPAAIALALAGTDATLAISPRLLLAWRRARGVYVPWSGLSADYVGPGAHDHGDRERACWRGRSGCICDEVLASR